MIKHILTAVLSGLIMTVATPTLAGVDPYSIKLKNPTSTVTQGSGGLSFDNSQEVAGADQQLDPINPSFSITPGFAGLPAIFLGTDGFTFTSVDATNPLKVVVVTSATADAEHPGLCLKAGPNVEGLQGAVIGSKTVTLDGGQLLPVTLRLNFKLAKLGISCNDPLDPSKIKYTYTRQYDVDMSITAPQACPGGIAPCWLPISAGNAYHIHNPVSVPEPGSLPLLFGGAAALFLARQVRRGARARRG